MARLIHISPLDQRPFENMALNKPRQLLQMRGNPVSHKKYQSPDLVKSLEGVLDLY